MSHLEGYGVILDKNLIWSVIWELREEWRVAYLGFNRVKGVGIFIAWDVREAMLVIIDRYAAANLASKALETFAIMEKFRLALDEDAQQALLFSLCKYGYMEEAEEFMMLKLKPGEFGMKWLDAVSCHMLHHQNCSSEALKMLDKVKEMGLRPDLSTYNSMISPLCKSEKLDEAMFVLSSMGMENIEPDI
ncbi:hypothetical protein MLD38_028337 [Melastoma candidum]|uniref:Uncharacterized protein n=1 Tax=Melastoma candidum TaxID=119954 RepID=A0ACB9N0U2_9MYRT|nr:hypothetical protein MLD38_028337 [Melastoma candidum]